MIIELFLSIICIYFSGLSIQILLFKPKKVDLTNLAEIFGFGFGAVGFLMILASLLQIKFSAFLFFLLTIGFFLAVVLVKRPTVKKIKLEKLSFFDLLLIVVFFIFFIFFISLFLKIFSFPVWGYDAYAIWLARARAFFIDKSVNLKNLNWYWPQEHPPLWSLITGWFYIFFESADEISIRILPFLFYFLIIAHFLRLTKKRKALSYLFAFFLITLPQLFDNVANPLIAGNADLLLSFYFFLAITTLYQRKFAQAGIFLALGSWVKSDAAPAVLIFIVLIFLFKIKKKIKPIALAFLPLFFLFVGKYFLDIRSRYLHLVDFKFSPAYLWYDLMAFREEMRNLPYWGFLWWFFIFFGIVNFKKIIRKKNVLFAYLIIVFQILSYVLIFLITPEDQAGHIASALFRLLLHLAPSVLFLNFVQASILVKNSK